MMPNKTPNYDLKRLVGLSCKALIDVAASGKDPEPMVWLFDSFLNREAGKNKEFKDASKKTDAGASLYEADDEADGAIPPRQASWERIRHYLNVAKDEQLLLPREKRPDDDSADYLAAGGARGSDDGEDDDD